MIKNKKAMNMLTTFMVVIILILVVLLISLGFFKPFFTSSEDLAEDNLCKAAIDTSNKQNIPLDTSQCQYLDLEADDEKELADIIVRCSRRLNNLNPRKVMIEGTPEHKEYSEGKKIFLFACSEVNVKKDLNLIDYMYKTKFDDDDNYLSFLSSDPRTTEKSCDEITVDEEYLKNQKLEKGQYLIYGAYPNTLNLQIDTDEKIYDTAQISESVGIAGAGVIVFGTGFIGTGIVIAAGIDYFSEEIIKSTFPDFKYTHTETVAETIRYPIAKTKTIFRLVWPTDIEGYEIQLDKICSNVFATLEGEDNVAAKYLFMRSNYKTIKGEGETLDYFSQGIIIVKQTDNMFNNDNVLVYYPPKVKDNE